MLTIRIDFETRSEVNLKKIGSWMYSKHRSTEVMCLRWKARDETGFYHMAHPWTPASEPPHRLFELLKSGEAVLESHNAMFEYCVWQNICVSRLGWPTVPDHMWRCSAAKASACALPRALGGAGNALGLDIVKDEGDGKKALMKVTAPARRTKKNTEMRWNEDEIDIRRMWAYNEDDVLSEEALSARLPPLNKNEQAIWEMDQRMNRRGICADVKGATFAIQLAAAWCKTLNDRLTYLTDGEVDAGTKREKVKAFLEKTGLDLPDTTAGTLDALLKGDKLSRETSGLKLLSDLQREILTIVRSVGRTSIKKYQGVIDRADADGRIRDSMMYHGASTGRWAGKGVQPHNFPRGKIKDMEQAWEILMEGDLEMIQLLYGDPMEFMSHCLRGVLWAPPGRRLYCADYAAIEARVLLWLVGDESGLDVFRRGEDIYLEMASLIYGRTMTKKDTDARQLGKQAILGLGYGMGFVKFLVTCRQYNMRFSIQLIKSIVPAGWYNATYKWILGKDKDKAKSKVWETVLSMIPDATDRDIPELILMKYIVDKYRQRFKKVVQSWYELEGEAIAAVQNPGKIYTSCKTQWCYQETPFPALKCKLPSGRILYYPYAEVRTVRVNRGSKKEPKWEQQFKLTYMTVDAKTYQWVRVGTYGGKLMENIDQAVSRDLIAEAMMRCDKSGVYDMIMSVHDEAVAETDEDEGDLQEFLELVSVNPEWAPGLPVKAEGWTGRRYRKA